MYSTHGLLQAGKSLYTTIRELVENSLDAAESIGALPLISLVIEEFTEAEFNEHRGMDNRDVVDTGLFKVKPSIPFSHPKLNTACSTNDAKFRELRKIVGASMMFAKQLTHQHICVRKRESYSG